MGEPTIHFGERAEAALDGRVERGAAPDRQEDAQRGAPGGESGVVQPSIPAVGDDGTATSRLGIRPAR